MRKITGNIRVLLAAALLFLFVGCGHKEIKAPVTDTPGSGTIEISADESFAPVIREQIAVYEAAFPGTKINVHFKSEADCFRDFFRDSATRLVIVTRGLTDAEDRILTDSLKFRPGWEQVASDAVVILLNTKSTDTVFSLERLRQQLTGKFKREQTIVFDGINKTSSVRFVQDSILKGKSFDTSVVRAVRNSSEVIDYVASHEDAVGLVGINRIGNPEDSAQVSLRQKVKFAYLKCDACVNTPFVYPSQASIMSHRYPLVRGLYYLIKENYTGLGSGFVSFLKYERGQLIFRRSYLSPVMGFEVRDVMLNDKLPDD